MISKQEDATSAVLKSEVIQVLRFIASALVVTTHATFYFSERVDRSAQVWSFGVIGVPIFFVISGLVMIISTVPLPTNTYGATRFFRRRVIRIVPLYWAVTLAKVMVAIGTPSLVNHNHFDLVYAIKSFLFVPAFNAEGEIRPIHGVGWTLLHEMFFYILFAGAMACRVRPVWAVSTLIIGLYLVGQIWPPTSASAIVITNGINLCFVLGMLLGQFVVIGLDKSTSAKRAIIAITLVLSLSVAVNPSWVQSIIPINGWVIVIALITVFFIHARIPARAQLFARLGDSSYALYLLHPIFCPALVIILSKVFGSTTPVYAISMAVIATIWLSHIFHALIEERMTDAARRMWPERIGYA